MADMVNHPPHYVKGKVECIDCIEAAVSDLPGVEGFLTGQVMKYMYRWDDKGGVEDLKKARWYLDRLISRYPEGEAENHDERRMEEAR